MWVSCGVRGHVGGGKDVAARSSQSLRQALCSSESSEAAESDLVEECAGDAGLRTSTLQALP